MKYYIGIDIGLNGAITIISSESKIKIIKMPLIGEDVDYHKLNEILYYYSPITQIKDNTTHIVFEKLGVIFGTSKSTAFSMGYQSGSMEMICIANEIPYTKVSAKVWQKEMFQGVDEIKKIGKTSRDTKKMALVACKRLYPDTKLTFGDRATKPHNGLIDSLLIANYNKRHF